MNLSMSSTACLTVPDLILETLELKQAWRACGAGTYSTIPFRDPVSRDRQMKRDPSERYIVALKHHELYHLVSASYQHHLLSL